MKKHRKQNKKGMTKLVKEQCDFIPVQENPLFAAFMEAREEFQRNYTDENPTETDNL